MNDIYQNEAYWLYHDGTLGCKVCGHFSDQKIDCKCGCHEYLPEGDVESLSKTLYYQDMLKGSGFNSMKANYHDAETNFDGITKHLIDDKTHHCIFCGKLDQRGVIPFLYILGSIP